MKGILVGDWKWYIYEHALKKGFEENGIKIIPFEANISQKYFIQSKIKIGNKIKNLQKELLGLIYDVKPNFVFFQRPVLIYPSTIKRIKEIDKECKLVSYHNDNPFINIKMRLLNRNYLNSLQYFDINYFYRYENIFDARKKINISNAKTLLPYFIEGFHNNNFKVRKKEDVAFIGHFERDIRVAYLTFLQKNDIKLKIYGPNWKTKFPFSNLNKLEIYPPLLNQNYVKKIQSAKICLVFLSKMNKDVYTRRCFEIPAAGTFMLCQRTKELQAIYREGIDCDFFSSKEELLAKVNYYLKNDKLRENIAKSGQIKSTNGEYSNVKICKQILNDIKLHKS